MFFRPLHGRLDLATTDANLRRRGYTVIDISLILLGLILIAVPTLFSRADWLPSLGAIVVGIVMIISSIGFTRRGYVDLASWILVLTTAIAVMPPSLLRPEVSSSLFYLILPLIIAGMVLRPWQLWLIVGLVLAIIGVKYRITSPDLLAPRWSQDILINGVLSLTTAGIISFLNARNAQGAFDTVERAQRAAEHTAADLARLNTDLEEKIAAATIDLRAALADVEARSAHQQMLLDEIASQRATIREMSVPVLPIRRDALVVPLVGALDSSRIVELQDQVLGAIEQSRARTILLDITGVPIVDTQVARGLLETIQSARLIGAEPMLIGIRPEVAQAIVSLGIDLRGVRTEADLESALRSV